MKDTLDIHRSLLERERQHRIVRLPRLIVSADELPEVLDLHPQRCLVTRTYEAGGQLLAFVVHAGRTSPLAAVLNAAGVKDARPAPPDVVNRATDYAAGLVAPLLLPPRVRVFVDRRTVDETDPADVVYTATGDSGTALRLRVDDLLELSGAKPADLATREIEVPELPGAVQPGIAPLRTFAGRPGG